MADSAEDRLARLDAEDPAGDYAELGALYASVVPVFGGAVSQVLSAWSAERRYERVRDVLRGVAHDLALFKGTVREEYIRSDEFADLLDQTLRRVVTERSEAKRQLYRGLLAAAATGATDTYDEQLHVVQVIDALQGAHISVLRAILEEPPKGPDEGISGSFLDTLKRRLPGFTEQRIVDLVGQLNSQHVANIGSLHSMMTWRGAQDMRGTLLPLGKRLVAYLRTEGGI